MVYPASYWLRRAEEARALVLLLPPDAQSQMLEVARGYEIIAHRVETVDIPLPDQQNREHEKKDKS